MRNMMFNDNFILTELVVKGEKTMTRRKPHLNRERGCRFLKIFIKEFFKPVETQYRYQIGEVLAVAMSYENALKYCNNTKNTGAWANIVANRDAGCPGDYNKMFVKPELMPVKIQITGRKLELLQNISDADCLKEGIVKEEIGPGNFIYSYFNARRNKWFDFPTPKEAFAALYNAINGKGAFENGGLTEAYEFRVIEK